MDVFAFGPMPHSGDGQAPWHKDFDQIVQKFTFRYRIFTKR